jgi:hypothetical protein
MTSTTLSVHVNCEARVAYDFAADPRNLPKWAGAFCLAARPSGDAWMIDTPQGPMGFRFVPRNELGVLDHFVKPTPDTEIYCPMRVVSHGTGCVILFTLLRSSEMTDEQFTADAAMIQGDFAKLKTVLETQQKAGDPAADRTS